MTLKSTGGADFVTAIVANVNSGKAFYDRNPLYKAIFWSASAIAPHGFTQRASYTVPTGRRFYLQNALVFFYRKTAAAPADEVLLQIDETTSVAIAYASMFSKNNPGDGDKSNLGSCGYFDAGKILEISSRDLSTGGTVTYDSGFMGTEFDV